LFYVSPIHGFTPLSVRLSGYYTFVNATPPTFLDRFEADLAQNKMMMTRCARSDDFPVRRFLQGLWGWIDTSFDLVYSRINTFYEISSTCCTASTCTLQVSLMYVMLCCTADNVGMIAGMVVGVVLVVGMVGVAGVLVYVMWWRRRKHGDQSKYTGISVVAHPPLM
jgi:hypothetical protein